jgi:hypothetical protein
MSLLNPSQVILHGYLRVSLLSHTLLINPSPHGRLELITCPNYHGGWNARIIVLTQNIYECLVLAHVSNSAGELPAMQDLLYELQLGSRRRLAGARAGDLLRFKGTRDDELRTEGRDRGRSMDSVQRSPPPTARPQRWDARWLLIGKVVSMELWAFGIWARGALIIYWNNLINDHIAYSVISREFDGKVMIVSL